MGELRVRLLGGLDIEGIVGIDGGTGLYGSAGLDQRALGSRKARTLVKALALARGRPVAAETLADMLWPDDPPANPAEQLRVLVSRLRKILGPDRVPRTDAGYSLSMDWLDLDALQELVGEAGRRLDEGSIGAARAAAGAALAVARGPLLPDEEEAEWAAPDRALARRLTTEARRILAAAALASATFPALHLPRSRLWTPTRTTKPSCVR
ncbi:MAG: winged helix-turn-helix domain-containing protein [Actinomycetota bacterium]